MLLNLLIATGASLLFLAIVFIPWKKCSLQKRPKNISQTLVT
jgi:hypothetical protein